MEKLKTKLSNNQTSLDTFNISFQKFFLVRPPLPPLPILLVRLKSRNATTTTKTTTRTRSKTRGEATEIRTRKVSIRKWKILSSKFYIQHLFQQFRQLSVGLYSIVGLVNFLWSLSVQGYYCLAQNIFGFIWLDTIFGRIWLISMDWILIKPHYFSHSFCQLCQIQFL